jgi:hypothetical protein
LVPREDIRVTKNVGHIQLKKQKKDYLFPVKSGSLFVFVEL